MDGINFNFKPNISPGSSGNFAGDGIQLDKNLEMIFSSQNAPISINLSDINMLNELLILKSLTLNSLLSSQLNNLTKELLNLPKEFNELLMLLAFTETPEKELLNLLKTDNPPVSVEKLQKLLLDNSKEVLNKLLKLMNNNSFFMDNNNQFREILGFLDKITTVAKASPADTLTATLLLYLPWLPLTEAKNFNLTFGFQKEESEGESSEEINSEVLVMFIRTSNLGVFKVSIITGSLRNIDINIENDACSPEILERIISIVTEEIYKVGIKPNINFKSITRQEEKEIIFSKKETIKSLSIHPSGKVSAITINCAYIIANCIFESDERVEVLKNREEKIK